MDDFTECMIASRQVGHDAEKHDADTNHKGVGEGAIFILLFLMG